MNNTDFINAQAAIIFCQLPHNKQSVVAFGMTPIEAHQELAAICSAAGVPLTSRDSALAFMAACNKQGPGMRA